MPLTSRFWPKSAEGRWYLPCSIPRSSSLATCTRTWPLGRCKMPGCRRVNA
jgi:hypothetical protein